jgi:thiamine-monophosphate kinase
VSELRDLGEFPMIHRIAAHGLARSEGVVKGIGDDCAVLSSGSDSVLLVTTDTLVEGSHFTIANTAPEGLGYKLLAVSLSDIAAMGGTPRDAVLAVSAPGTFDAGYLERVFDGLFACGRRFGVNIVGGDTTEIVGPLVFSLTLMGRSAADKVVYRSGARPGDRVYVSGTLGDAGAGLRISEDFDGVSSEDRQHLLRRFHRPEPRVDLGKRLADSGMVSAMIDLSDGPASDLGHIAKASQVDLVIDFASIPISDALASFCESSKISPVEWALTAGEDYELALTGGHEIEDKFMLKNDLHCIGEVVDGEGFTRERISGNPLEIEGFSHFKGNFPT